MPTCWHLDTSALINRQIFNCLTYRKRNLTYKVSVVALGELLLKCGDLQNNSGWERYLDKIVKLIDRVIYPYVPEREVCLELSGNALCVDISEILQEVLKADNRISVNDALIITHALVDEDCTGLITTDRKVLSSEGLDSLAEKYGKELVGPEHLGCDWE